MPAYNQGSQGRRNSFKHPQHLSGRQLPPLNTNVYNSGSKESLQLPIQHPSPIEPSQTLHPYSQIKCKPVPGRDDTDTLPYNAFAVTDADRRDSDTLGDFDSYHEPATVLKDSRVNLLRYQLVPRIYSSHASIRDASQDQINGINLRCEPDRSIRSPISPEGRPQGNLYQRPVEMSWLQQSLQDPKARLRAVHQEAKLTRGSHVVRGTEEPRHRLQQLMKKQAQPEYIVLKSIRRERVDLQRTKHRLNDGYDEPLLPSREKEDGVADAFGREFERRQNAPKRRLRKPMVERRSGLVEKVVRYEGKPVVQEDFSGWYGGSRKRDRVWKKCKVVLAKMLKPKQNKWQRI